ncbi:hydroquinone glucosyltransferase-like [Trifolium pratense]|uniref:hydroquinone glucosyltransferase-like n=1 Tax=Trifolium pratense TaxID=57577 RepID=UPI001E69009A|nr:hydroquinone glucosyltransferase-like [Trifolium pratense]
MIKDEVNPGNQMWAREFFANAYLPDQPMFPEYVSVVRGVKVSYSFETINNLLGCAAGGVCELLRDRERIDKSGIEVREELKRIVCRPGAMWLAHSAASLPRRLSLTSFNPVHRAWDLEPDAIRVLQERQKPCVYPVGPIIRNESNSEANMSVSLRWLEKQPPNSVVFVSFGSGGTLSHEQLNELAFGLEMIGHKFLWVVTSWAPQVEILGHGSTGGFLSHCGWSSTLESVVNGVPVIAWPLFAEQKMNAKLLTDVLKVAVRPKIDDENGIVKREEVAKAIKRIMEGDESFVIRKRIEELRDGAANALSENGSSRKALSDLALKWH